MLKFFYGIGIRKLLFKKLHKILKNIFSNKNIIIKNRIKKYFKNYKILPYFYFYYYIIYYYINDDL